MGLDEKKYKTPSTLSEKYIYTPKPRCGFFKN